MLLALPMLLLFSSCSEKYHQKRTLFRLTTDGSKIDTTKLRIAVNRAARNYVIQPNDYLDVRVYTNKGERILDPNGELQFGQPSGVAPSLTRGSVAGVSSGGGGGGGGGGQRSGGGASSSGNSSSLAFLVQADGTVKLPVVDRVRLSGLSLLQADSVLQKTYNSYYKDSFVTTRVTNNRVFVLGSPGGKVIQLENDNMNLIEVLALAGGIDGSSGGGSSLNRYGGRTDNIRIIRGNLKNPQVQEIDLTTIEGMRRGNLQVEPNDIIYVDPVRRPFLEAITDAGPVIQLLSLTALLYNTFRPR